MSKRYDDDSYFDEIDYALRRRYGNDFDDEEESEEFIRERRRNLTSKEKKRIKEKIKKAKKQRRRKKILKACAIFLTLIIAFVCFLVFTEPGKKLALRMASYYAKFTMNSEGEPFKKPTVIKEGYKYSDDVINILLVGIEENGGARNTDSMVIVSMNTATGKITLVSLLRDTYVNIYGTSVKRKLNYAYGSGGMDALINTIQDTYKIYINGYAYVNFEKFEEVVDKVGGVDIELGEVETNYLNREFYISNPEYRNLHPGWNHLNGNQALGYCRVRKVPTIEGVYDDYGRTLRQRKVLTNIFEHYKDQSLTDMVKTANYIFESITTNMTSGNIYTILSSYVDHKTDTLEQVMLPKQGLFDEKLVEIGAVISIDGYEQRNIDYIHDMLYGDETNGEVENGN